MACCMQVTLCDGAFVDDQSRADALESLGSAKAAAELHATLAAQRSSSGTGEMLRSNFVVVADLVVQQDGHLLTDAEIATIADFKVSADGC